jgi:hypothetical protein
MTTAPAEAPTITEPISGNPHFFPMNWNITIAAVIVIGLAAVGFTLYSAEVTTHMTQPVHQAPNELATKPGP